MDPAKIKEMVLSGLAKTEEMFKSTRRTHPLGGSSFDRLCERKGFGRGGDLTYEEYATDNFRLTEHPSRKSLDKRLEILSTAMNYVPMSPKNKNRQERTYVAPENIGRNFNFSSILAPKRATTLNTSKAQINWIMNFWMARAAKLAGRDIHSAVGIPGGILPLSSDELTRFVIRGKPGVGKTAFLNYLFSVDAPAMIEHKIMWVRVDLNNPQGADLNLRSLLFEKFYRIFCSYYFKRDTDNFGVNFVSLLKTYLEKQVENSEYLKSGDEEPPSIVGHYIDFLNALHDECNRYNLDGKRIKPNVATFIDEFFSDRIKFTNLSNWLLTFIQRRLGFGYIFMFDGLDSVTIDYAQVKDFERWLSQLDALTLNSKNMFGTVSIITMRDYSFIEYYKRIQVHQNNPNFKEFRISKQPLKEIMGKRIWYAIELLKENGYENVTERQLYFALKNLLRITYIGIGIEYANRNLEELVSEFSSINNDNFRATMRFFREIVQVASAVIGNNSFVELTAPNLYARTSDRIKRKTWWTIRLMLFGDCKVSCYRNRIKYFQKGDNVRTDVRKPNMIDINNGCRAVIPNIFNAREYVYDPKKAAPKNLFKLRAIQFLIKQPGRRASVKEIIEWYKDSFGYAENDLRFDLREMIYNGILVPDCPDHEIFDHEVTNDNYKVELSKLGDLMLNHMIWQNIYYQVVVDDTPIQREYAAQMRPLAEFDREINHNKFITQKTNNGYSFYLYLKAVEDYELSQCQRDPTKKSSPLLCPPPRIFTEDLGKKIQSDIVRSIIGYIESREAKGIKSYAFINSFKREFQIA